MERAERITATITAEQRPSGRLTMPMGMRRWRPWVAGVTLAVMGAVVLSGLAAGFSGHWVGLICVAIAATGLLWPAPTSGDATALRQATQVLADAHTPETMATRLHAVLANYYQGIYILEVEHADYPQLRCLHEVKRHHSVAALPERFAGGEFPPIAQLLNTKRPCRHQSTNDTMGSRALRFWHTYGLTSLWPARMDEEDPIRVVIALGPPKGKELEGATLLALGRLLASGLALLENQRDLAGREQTLQQSVTEAHHSLSVALDGLEQARVKLMEAEKQAIVGHLAAGVVHEVNSPLGTVASSAETIASAMARIRTFVEQSVEVSDATAIRKARRALNIQDSALQTLAQGQARLGAVMARLARFANLDSAEIKSVDLRTSLEDVTALVSAQSPQQINFTLDLPEDPLLATCLPTKLNLAFFNLVQNAAAAIDGSGTVSIGLRRRAAREGLPAMAEVTVRDTGRGVAEDKLPGLLNLAFTTGIGGRVGLRTGLPATKQAFVELGGALVIESEVAKGTHAVATVPLTRAGRGPAIPPSTLRPEF